MNCVQFQNRVLNQADPTVLDGQCSHHLKGCGACRGWHVKISQTEQAIRMVAFEVNTGAKARFIKKFLSDPAIKAPEPFAPVQPTTIPVAERSVPSEMTLPGRKSLRDRLARLWPAGVAAAVVLGGTLIWTALDRRGTNNDLAAKPADPFLDKVVTAKIQVDSAKSTKDRLDALCGLSDLLHEQARGLAKIAPGQEMKSLAGLYDEVVSKAVTQQARWLSDDEKRAVLGDYIARLGTAEQEAERMAAESPVNSAEALRDIARCARQGKELLSELRRRAS